MYELIRPVVKDKTVLELATGTGLIAKYIVKATAHIEVTDASPEMITEAMRQNDLVFEVQAYLKTHPCLRRILLRLRIQKENKLGCYGLENST